MITDDPRDGDVIIEQGIATPLFFSFIDQVKSHINAFAAASGLITVEDEGTPLSTAVETINFIGSGVTATNVGNDIDVTILSGGDMVSTNDLSDVSDAAQARVNLNVDIAGTDNSTDVTLVGAGDYLSISGQEITQRELTEDDITMAQLIKDIHEVGDDIYVGEALPNTATSAASWRMYKVSNVNTAPSKRYADGDSDFDNVMNDYLTKTYP